MKDSPASNARRSFQVGPSIASVAATIERRQRWVRLARATLAVLAVMAIGTVGFLEMTGTRFSPIEALYMTVISISTVGFGEVIPIDTDGLRLFTMGLILFGGASVVYFLAAAAAFIIEGDILFGFVRRRLEARLARVEHHVIVAGLGRVGRHTFAEILAARVPVVGVDLNEARLEELVATHGDRILFASGEAHDERVLNAVGITRAAAIIAALPDDRENFLLAVAARQLNPNIRLLVRLADPQNAALFHDLDAAAIVHPPTSTGRRIANMLLHGPMVAFVDQLLAPDGRALEVMEYRCPGSLARHLVRDLPDDPAEPRVFGLAHRGRDTATFRPPGWERVEEGDTLYLLGHHRALLRFSAAPYTAPPATGTSASSGRDDIAPEPSAERVIVVGAGDIGRAIAGALIRAGAQVTLVDPDATSLAHCDALEGLGQTPCARVHGDAFDRAVLIEAGLSSATTVVATLPAVRDNLFLAATVRRLSANVRILARVDDKAEARRLSAVGATVFNQGQIAGVNLARLAIHPALATFADGLEATIETPEQLRVLALPHNSPLNRVTLENAGFRPGVHALIVGYRRQPGTTFRFQPQGSTRLQAGAELLALGTPDQLAALATYIGVARV